MSTSLEQLKKNRAFLCLECGKCTAVCPISRYNDRYSPRRLVAEGLFYGAENLAHEYLLWSCLTCQLCSQRCPVDVHYSEYMRDIRAAAHAMGASGQLTHGGGLHHIMEMHAEPKLKQNRTGWITDDLKVSKKGDVLYFTGCLPYYQELFGKDFEFEPVSIARDTVRILNHLGIEPVVMENERCCGHDLYWTGNLEKFDQLGMRNLEEIEKTGARTIITACPECAYTLKRLYPERVDGIALDVKHIAEVVSENMAKFSFGEVPGEFSYQDPCRLGRYMGVYEEPREVLAAIPGLRLHEMPRNRRGAICCGTTNWMNCDTVSKQIQFNRLTEAKTSGAETMITACPKCQIHFRCSECGDQSQKVDIKIADFVNIVASAITARGVE